MISTKRSPPKRVEKTASGSTTVRHVSTSSRTDGPSERRTAVFGLLRLRAVLIVALAQDRVAQGRVCEREGLEELGRFRVVGILVWMQLARTVSAEKGPAWLRG
jgi:hypothetical protein